ncbi:MAG: hypothetical protein WD069_16700 [Planctomycetales bacterium]
MTRTRLASTALVLTAGVGIGLLLSAGRNPERGSLVQAQEPAGKPAPEPAALQAEFDVAKGKLPDQAHAMVSVAYHFNNLWFAGQHGNWPLAQFYFNETRSHLRWAVRIIPVRKDDKGQEVQLGAILEAVENSPLKQLQESIEAKDRDKFVAAYEFTLTSCYACHKASDKPYLTLRIPDHPAEPMIDFAPLPAPFPEKAPPSNAGEKRP